MIIESDIFLADHEASSMDKPWVYLREYQYQPVHGAVKGFLLYNVVAGHYTTGSTVTIQNMLNLGLRVEVVR